MIVPNYVPDPLEVPGNVTEERYPVRVAFFRRVVLSFALSVATVAALALLPWPATSWVVAGIVLALVLVLLDIWRIRARGARTEALGSSWGLVLIVPAVAFFAERLFAAGIPSWAPAVGVGAISLYTLLCGRDFSFVGCWLLSLIGSSVVCASILNLERFEPMTAAWALGLNAAVLTYLVYDLASLTARRRKHEVAAAVTDLYRDVFNFVGYTVRCIRHWKKHRIWG